MEESQIANIIITIVSGASMLLAGIIMKKYPPSYINMLYGYRTKRSMKNQLLWDISQTYSAELMIKYSMIYIVVCFLISLLIPGVVTTFVIMGLLFVKIAIFITKVERRLKEMELKLDQNDE